ncbi:unnamed protein product [Psylliodes chrysocephalus]|uniref:Uncharacterized protein n=1 Tax=Psylliodes chrysocephalus TaxID=3402493 RepID=A0A9P0CJS6_9CUCU|nr:unnamed protein product [Psylliodes chrysocephala]
MNVNVLTFLRNENMKRVDYYFQRPDNPNRRPRHKSTITTLTPNKKELEEKERKKKLRTNTNKEKAKKAVFDEDEKQMDKQKETVDAKDIFCPVCEEEYEDPPTLDWIRCSKCNI